MIMEVLRKVNFHYYCYGSVKKTKCSFNCHLQIDKIINNVKKMQRRKPDSNFDFSQAA